MAAIKQESDVKEEMDTIGQSHLLINGMFMSIVPELKVNI